MLRWLLIAILTLATPTALSETQKPQQSRQKAYDCCSDPPEYYVSLNSSDVNVSIDVELLPPGIHAGQKRMAFISPPGRELVLSLDLGVERPWLIVWSDGAVYNVQTSVFRRKVAPTRNTTYHVVVYPTTINNFGTVIGTVRVVVERPPLEDAPLMDRLRGYLEDHLDPAIPIVFVVFLGTLALSGAISRRRRA